MALAHSPKIATKGKGVIFKSIKPRFHTDGHYTSLWLG
jgi:hypothetical protein